MELKMFGCCSGTEPMPNLKHTSYALIVNDEVYFFDAGEGCSNTAQLMGVDLTKVSNVFISHTHMDHVGGLFNLIYFVYKLSIWNKTPMINDGRVGLFIPNIQTWEGVLHMLMHTTENIPWKTGVQATRISDGCIYQDKNIKVTAYHNNHIPDNLSFSFKVESQGKTIVFSGDLKQLSDLESVLTQECDYLLIETGHHKIKDVCNYVNTKKIKNVIFMHHGREVLSNIQQARLEAQKYAKCNVFFAEDRDSITL